MFWHRKRSNNSIMIEAYGIRWIKWSSDISNYFQKHQKCLRPNPFSPSSKSELIVYNGWNHGVHFESFILFFFYLVWESCVNVNMCWINPVITVAPYNDVFPSCHITVDYYFFFFAILHLIFIPYPSVNIPDYLNSF